MRINRTRRWLLVGVATLVLVGALSFVTVGERITSIDLSTVYPNLQNHNGGRGDTVIRAGEYPAIKGITYYYFKTSRGSIMLACSLDDFNSWIDSRRRWKIGRTSEPIGQDAFFMNRTASEETLELAYRRHNLGVCFRNGPVREYRGGRPIFTTEADKTELEQTARMLDDAIRHGNPTIKVENVRLYQVVSYKVRRFVGGLCWMLYGLFHPNAHM